MVYNLGSMFPLGDSSEGAEKRLYGSNVAKYPESESAVRKEHYEL